VEQGEHLIIHCQVIPDHLLGEGLNCFVFRLLQRENGRPNVSRQVNTVNWPRM
jgi:hypothetical protein